MIASDRPAGALLGWSVLAGWVSVMVVAFALLWTSARPAVAGSLGERDAVLMRDWLRAQPGFREGRASIAWVQGDRCGCPGIDESRWPTLQARWRDADADVYRITPAGGLPGRLSHVEVVIADARGEPVYAGAYDATPVCGGRTTTDLLLAAAQAAPLPEAATPAAPVRTSLPSCGCT